MNAKHSQDFQLERLTEYSQEAILAEIRRVASIVEQPVLTLAEFEKHSNCKRKPIYRCFGNWGDALRAAGLEHRFGGGKGSGAQPSKVMSDEELLLALGQLAKRLGQNSLTVEDVERNLPFTRNVLIKRWGTSRAAFEAAGLQVRGSARRYTDEECFENMLAVWTHFGRPPKYREMGVPPSEVGGKAYVKRFGSWTRALEAFVDRINGPESVEKAELVAGRQQVDMGRNSPVRDKRDVPLSLRFKVLTRDNFKCTKCGDSPAMTPGCILHVDHIIPWSKGGPTSEENLRTLCALCNLGRSNRYMD